VVKVEESKAPTSFLPRRFFTVKGSAMSDVSAFNAFDAALVKAGIGQCNLVLASSILPRDAEEVPQMDLTPGTITFTVMAHVEGVSGETVSAGIGFGWLTQGNEVKYGIVAESYGIKDEERVDEELRERMREMARIRGLLLNDVQTVVKSIKVTRKYGSVVAALIFLP